MGLETILEPQPYLVDNPNLQDGFGPIQEELVTTNLEVIGEIPTDFSGMYVRNGPVPQYKPKGKYHWFDGDGMLHAVHFQKGKVSYRNRWVKTEGLAADQAAGESLSPGLKERMPEGVLPDDALKNTSNTDVKFHNGKLLSMWYRGGAVYQVDPHTLDTLGKLENDPRLKGLQISAH
jgi:carotenoid cleavage dioxygenase-like enzyme